MGPLIWTTLLNLSVRIAIDLYDFDFDLFMDMNIDPTMERCLIPDSTTKYQFEIKELLKPAEWNKVLQTIA